MCVCVCGGGSPISGGTFYYEKLIAIFRGICVWSGRESRGKYEAGRLLSDSNKFSFREHKTLELWS